MTAPGLATGTVHGAVLAGGASRRMGADKALVEVGGRPMASRVVGALRQAGCDPVLAVGGDRRLQEWLGIDVVADRWPGEGPLGAIITAIEHAAGAPVVVVACDLPWISGTALRALIDSQETMPLPSPTGAGDELPQVVVARTDRLEPLCAVWQPTALEPLLTAFEAGERAVHAALGRLRVRHHEVDAMALRNVNTPEDLAHVRRVEGTS